MIYRLNISHPTKPHAATLALKFIDKVDVNVTAQALQMMGYILTFEDEGTFDSISALIAVEEHFR